MKRFLTYGILIAVIAILPNFIVGLLRTRVNDFIPYTQQKNKDFYGTALEKELNYQLAPTTPVADMSRLPIRPEPTYRASDMFGFSNMVENKSPEILYIGDSFFNDPHSPTNNGIQAQTNDFFHKNIAYNIGAHNCGGFNVYNELNHYFFKKKPRLIVFEAVERNAYEIIKNAPNELRKNSFKSVPYKNYYLDLLLGNNFKDLNKSKLWHQEVKPVLGTAHYINNQKIWFLNNHLTSVSDYEINKMIDSMKMIQTILQPQNIHIVFLIAPDKESVYPELFGASYLPALQNKMKAQNLDYIDVFSTLKNKGAEYYYEGDTHWNAAAIKLVSKETINKFQTITSNQ